MGAFDACGGVLFGGGGRGGEWSRLSTVCADTIAGARQMPKANVMSAANAAAPTRTPPRKPGHRGQLKRATTRPPGTTAQQTQSDRQPVLQSTPPRAAT